MEIWEEISANREIGARRLVAEFGDRLFRVAIVLCKDEHLAEDLVFRTFERIISKISRFDPKMSFWNWMYAVMYNLFRSDMRKSKAEVAADAEWFNDAVELGAQPLNADSLAQADAGLIRRAVECLPPEFREVVVLRYFEDRTLDEMSQIMDIPVGTLKWRLHKARGLLFSMLERSFGNNNGGEK